MISGNLEYVMSSLPYLSFLDTEEEKNRVASLLGKYARPAEGKKTISSILDEEAGKFLTPDASRVLEQISLERIHGETFRRNSNRVLAAFSNYMFELRKGIQKLRVDRKSGLEPSAAKNPSFPLTPGTPLEEEIQLMKWQWDKLEELSIGHYADFGALCIYKLKLLILIRWWSFDPKRGFEKFLNSSKTD